MNQNKFEIGFVKQWIIPEEFVVNGNATPNEAVKFVTFKQTIYN